MKQGRATESLSVKAQQLVSNHCQCRPCSWLGSECRQRLHSLVAGIEPARCLSRARAECSGRTYFLANARCTAPVLGDEAVIVISLAEVGLLSCINCHPVPRGTRNHLHEAHSRSGPHFRLTRGSSWIWKSRKAVSQRRCSPTNFSIRPKMR